VINPAIFAQEKVEITDALKKLAQRVAMNAYILEGTKRIKR
jgi:UTP-glucose-1-phosphate uridylyltransferase